MLPGVVMVMVVFGVAVATRPSFIFRVIRPQNSEPRTDGRALHIGEEDYMASVYLQDGYLVIQELSEESPKFQHRRPLEISAKEIHFVGEVKSIDMGDNQELRGFDLSTADEEIIIAADVANRGWDEISKLRRKGTDLHHGIACP